MSSRVHTRQSYIHLWATTPKIFPQSIADHACTKIHTDKSSDDESLLYLTKKYVLLEKIPYVRMYANVCNACHIIYVSGNYLVFLCVFLGNHRTLCTCIHHTSCTRMISEMFSDNLIFQAITYFTWNTLESKINKRLSIFFVNVRRHISIPRIFVVGSDNF